MAIINRDLESSQQKEVVYFRNSTQFSTGATVQVAVLPFPCVIESARSYVLGSSGAPELKFLIHRFAGGATAVVASISNMVLTAFGTSGVVGYSGLAAAGSTLLQCQAGDVLALEMAGANSAATVVLAEIVVKKTQDVVTYNGV